MFVDGFKLALPIVVLLFLVDQGLAAITRLQAQLQLLTLAFPVKILLSILFLGRRRNTLAGDFRKAGGSQSELCLADVRRRLNRAESGEPDQKTEKPTQQRLKKTRREGRFPSSRDFVSALQFITILVFAFEILRRKRDRVS